MTGLVRVGRGVVTLVGHLSRLVPFGHLLAGALVAAVAVVLNKPITDDVLAEMIDALRLAMAPLAMGTAFVLDDPVDDWLATPVPLASRRWVRVSLSLAALVVLWAGVLSVAEVAVGLPEGLPLLALSGELATLVAICLAVAAAAGRRLADRSGGVVAAPAVLLVAAIQLVLPARWALFVTYALPPAPGQAPSATWATWVAAHQRWALIAAVAVIVLAISCRDPARRSPRHLATTSEPASA